MSHLSDLEHKRIEARVFGDKVIETYYISDPNMGIRKKLQIKTWTVQRLIGSGSFGDVRLETCENGTKRAVKRLRDGVKNYEKELSALLEFSKPKYKEEAVFVDFFGWFVDDNNTFLAMEYVQLGDLEGNIQESRALPESEVQQITRQVLEGLQIMHKELYVHRDLKPGNILVVRGAPEWWVKLADFGITKRTTENTILRTETGTRPYMAPEIRKYLNCNIELFEYTDAVDLWALGCIVYRLISGTIPFESHLDLTKYCEDPALFPSENLLSRGMSTFGVDFTRHLLQPRSSQRPSATQALKHNWIPSDNNKLNRWDTDTHPGLRTSIESPKEVQFSKSSSGNFLHAKVTKFVHSIKTPVLASINRVIFFAFVKIWSGLKIILVLVIITIIATFILFILKGESIVINNTSAQLDQVHLKSSEPINQATDCISSQLGQTYSKVYPLIELGCVLLCDASPEPVNQARESVESWLDPAVYSMVIAKHISINTLDDRNSSPLKQVREGHIVKPHTNPQEQQYHKTNHTHESKYNLGDNKTSDTIY